MNRGMKEDKLVRGMKWMTKKLWTGNHKLEYIIFIKVIRLKCSGNTQVLNLIILLFVPWGRMNQKV